jgi:hypothetical protein
MTVEGRSDDDLVLRAAVPASAMSLAMCSSIGARNSKARRNLARLLALARN